MVTIAARANPSIDSVLPVVFGSADQTRPDDATVSTLLNKNRNRIIRRGTLVHAWNIERERLTLPDGYCSDVPHHVAVIHAAALVLPGCYANRGMAQNVKQPDCCIVGAFFGNGADCDVHGLRGRRNTHRQI